MLFTRHNHNAVFWHPQREVGLASTTTLLALRDRYFAMHDRGIITASETSNAFIDLLTDATNDESALSLFVGIPGWFRAVLRESLDEMSTTGYYRRRFGIGDSRTPEEVHRDAVLQQELLLRLAPRIQTVLQSSVE